jgi:L-2-hydroxyglutarate oxidase LhgO
MAGESGMERVDSVVIGAGVVGLAVARELARSGQEVIVVEAAGLIGSGTSSRNSEVIHAGIYYPQGSLKAQLCVAGRDKLYDFCRSRGVPHRALGKLIVAADDGQLDKLAGIRRHAEANGVVDLQELSGAQALALEPELACVAALLSPSTGIVDSHAFMLALLGEAEAAGAALALCSPLTGGAVEENGFRLAIGGAEPMEIGCTRVVNAAGLDAWGIARTLDGFPAAAIPPRHLAKGNYFSLGTGRSPFQRLVYPIPEDGGLGVHLTLDLGGQARFGPDVEWLANDDPAAVDYTVNPRRGDGFYAAIRRYWPGLPDNALQPAYAGVRPKLSGPGAAAADFLIQGPAEHGVSGLVNLFGIESPGLTSSMALAELVAERLA